MSPASSLATPLVTVNQPSHTCTVGRSSFSQSAADTPFARWLVGVAESRGWRSGRQAALYLGVNQAAVSTWLRGEVEPDRISQERLARATGTPVEEIADLVWRTKSQKQRLTVGDLQRMRAQEERTPASLEERLERIERRLEGIDRIERHVAEGLTRGEMQAILAEFIRKRDAGELPEEYLDDPDEPEAADDDPLRAAVG